MQNLHPRLFFDVIVSLVSIRGESCVLRLMLGEPDNARVVL